MSNGHTCHVVEGLIATPQAFKGEATTHLGTQPLEDPGEVSRILGRAPDQAPYQGPDHAPDHETLGRILNERIGLFRVEEGSERDEANRLREASIPAAPIHIFGRMNHISKMPGTKPENPFTQNEPPVLAASSRGRAIAVIDSGVTENMPGWLSSSIDYDEDYDLEVLPDSGKGAVVASHGVFVAGVIRRIAPEHTIYMSRTEEVPTSVVADANDPEHPAGDDPTSELDVAVAMFRVVDRLLAANGVEVNALNLSLGGEMCGAGDPLMVVLTDAIDYWVKRFPEAPIFAAGGNRDDGDPVYPAAFPLVRAVAAAEEKGKQVVWELDGTETDPPQRNWISDVAPGSKLTSPSGRDPDEWVEWSGSSFACAVASACSASRRYNEELDGLVYWPDRNVQAAEIPGLT